MNGKQPPATSRGAHASRITGKHASPVPKKPRKHPKQYGLVQHVDIGNHKSAATTRGQRLQGVSDGQKDLQPIGLFNEVGAYSKASTYKEDIGNVEKVVVKEVRAILVPHIACICEFNCALR
jgi:hypothetical protein